MTLHANTIGVDISKDRLDVFCRRSGTHWSVPNNAGEAARLAADHRDTRFVFEATSGCDRLLREALTAAGVTFTAVNPRRAREFARAAGFLAKTDRVDARVLAEMGHRLDLGPTVNPRRIVRRSPNWSPAASRSSATSCASEIGWGPRPTRSSAAVS